MTRLLPREAAGYIGCGYDQLMKMVRLKQIPCYRIGRRAFFVQESLDTWIAEQEEQSLKQSV